MSSATTQDYAEPENVVPRPEILRASQDALAKAHPGARVQYLFHGSSGTKQQDLDRAISSGVVKVNLDTDAQYAFTRAIGGHGLDHWQGVLKVDGGLANKHSFDPRTCRVPGRESARGAAPVTRGAQDERQVSQVQKTRARTGARALRDLEARPTTHLNRQGRSS